jgi:hypothetical protein
MTASDTATGIDSAAGYLFINGLIEQTLAHTAMTELPGTDGGSYMSLAALDDADAGYLRLWQGTAASPIDRMVHVRLLAGPVQTQLLFLFGKDDSPLPHFHAQAVEFPPDGCVYNIDLMPRLDAIEHPAYFTEVFSALTKSYLKATSKPENSCSKALMNPAIAAYLSPWGIVSHRTDTAELSRVQPLLESYLTHYLYLSDSLNYSHASAEQLQTRSQKHLERFFDDDLDPRAWRGVYNVIGEDAGFKIKHILKQSLQQN